MTGNERGKSFEPFRSQRLENYQPHRKALARLRDQDLSRLRGILEPFDQMNRRAARFVDRREVGFDDMGYNITRMNADADLKVGIVQQLDIANQLDRRLAGHDSMIVVCMRRPEKRDQAVPAFLADNSAVAPNRVTHGIHRRLKP